MHNESNGFNTVYGPVLANRSSAHEVGRPSNERHRVVIADPDPLARRAVRDLLQASGRFTVPGEAATMLEATELCRFYTPDAAVIETDFADVNEVPPARAIQLVAPTVRIVVFSRQDHPEAQLHALATGACGFLSKGSELEEVVPALEAVVRGEAAVPPQTAMALIEHLRRLAGGGLGMRPIRGPLTQREWEVLDLLSRGLDTHEIATRLVLTEETIYSHIKNVLRKLGVHSRAEAIARAEALRDPLAGADLGTNGHTTINEHVNGGSRAAL